MVFHSCNSEIWPSEISSTSVFNHIIGIQNLFIDQGENLYWQEKRPFEKGRVTIVKNGKDLLPKEISIGTKVHEYGGVSYLVVKDEIFFSHAKDQRIYQLKNTTITPITHDLSMRYADGSSHPYREYLYYVREEVLVEGDPKNTIVLIDLEKNREVVVAKGHDFFSSPRVSYDGKYLAFIAWDHPNMPWDSSYLYVSSILEDGSISEPKKIAGGKQISCMEPKWSKDNTLYFLDDRSGYWNLYFVVEGQVSPIGPLEAEFGYPGWVFGLSTYTITETNQVICTYVKKGKHCLAILQNNQFNEIDIGLVNFESLVAKGKNLYFIGSFADKPVEILQMDLKSHKLSVIKKTSDITIDKSYISEPENISFYSKEGEIVYGYFYPPKNPKYQTESPPLIVRVHGGPTAKATPSLNLEVQYWTSRGFAVADVNYRGSSGFGREYRERLLGKWGVVDVEDCVACAQFLVNERNIDKNKIVIKGRSSGGYTVLSALGSSSVFSAGCSYYGIADLEAMARETHKFEKHYLDGLVGPYPEKKALYIERSPMNFLENLHAPTIFFHGKKDRVVPSSQSEKVYQGLLEKGNRVSCLLFDNEGHGFKESDSLKKSLEAEVYFYAKIFALKLEEKILPIVISNLKEAE